MKWLFAIVSGLAALFKLINNWFGQKAKEKNQDDDNFKKIEDAVNSDKPVHDVQSAVDDYRNRL
jgi:hypothetical protein